MMRANRLFQVRLFSVDEIKHRFPDLLPTTRATTRANRRKQRKKGKRKSIANGQPADDSGSHKRLCTESSTSAITSTPTIPTCLTALPIPTSFQRFQSIRISLRMNYAEGDSQLERANIMKGFESVNALVCSAKSQLHDFREKVFWDFFRGIDPFIPLRSLIERRYQAKVVTNAWLKMYEILSRIPKTHLHPSTGNILKVFCNGELPGCFLLALNHYIRTRTSFDWHWVASSLYPSDKGILGDSYNLYERFRGRWLMDSSMAGDVTDLAQVDALTRRALAKLGRKADIYTSDVGFDVAPHYNRQEELTSHANLGQVLLGLQVLELGGTMVSKTFTFTSPFSVWLLAVCASLFQNFHVTKPICSRGTNSEVYCVGTGFRGLSPAVSRILRSAMHSMRAGNLAVVPVALPSAPIKAEVMSMSPAKHALAVIATGPEQQNTVAGATTVVCNQNLSATTISAPRNQRDLDKLPLPLLREIYVASKHFHGVSQVDHLNSVVNVFNFVKHSDHTLQWQRQIIKCIRDESSKSFDSIWELWFKDNPITSISIDQNI